MEILFKKKKKRLETNDSYAGLNWDISVNFPLAFHKAYNADNPRPTAPPMPHFRNPATTINIKYIFLIKFQ